MINKNTKARLALFLLLGMGALQSCEKDILTGQPSWLGNSIYERLEEGFATNDGQTRTFKYTLRLIDDLNQTEVYSHTGSRTLFATPDDVYDQWFQSPNSWHVTKYEDLTLAQKKLLFNSSNITDAYLLELMSNVSGNPPVEGMCMRRATAASVLDTVYTLPVSQMPVADAMGDPTRFDVWANYRDAGRAMKVFKDNSAAPMIHFLPKFMETNVFTSEDIQTLSNGAASDIKAAIVNGQNVISSEQTCKNGYIYVLDGVKEQNKNMADIINSTPNTTRWAQLINRFSVPVYDAANSREYNRINGTNDSIFTLRYYCGDINDHSSAQSRTQFIKTPITGNWVSAALAFDPGWNQYMYKNTMNYTLNYDAGAMLVPQDDVLEQWFETSPLKEEYGEWDNVPVLTLSKLLNVNMLPSLIDAVPSKFGDVLDDSKVELKDANGEPLTSKHVTKTLMGCNGVVYVTDRVYLPSEYNSVVFPALVYQNNMSVIYRGINAYDFGPFLNSMESRFTMMLPYNTSESKGAYTNHDKFPVMQYIDPCFYSTLAATSTRQSVIDIYYDTETSSLGGEQYAATITPQDGDLAIAGTLKANAKELTSSEIEDRMQDFIDNLIVLGDIKPGQEYYKTKAGSMIRIQGEGPSAIIQGGYQIEQSEKGNTTIKAEIDGDRVYQKANGVAYSIVKNAPQTSMRSVYQVLKNNPKCSKFFALLSEENELNDIISPTNQIDKDNIYYCADLGSGNQNITLMDNYNYTIYAPSNDAMDAIAAYLPTWDDVNVETDVAKRKKMAKMITDFIKYHIQDNSVCIKGEPVSGAEYESSMLNASTRRFYGLTVSADNSSLTVKGKANTDASKVLTNDVKDYNQLAREYWIQSAVKPTTTQGGTIIKNQSRSIVSSSHAVVHVIDQALFFDDSQMKPWQLK